jgi:nucleolar protein 12
MQPLQKELKRHILSAVPTARLDSIRFRSVAFQKPTTKLPSDADDPQGALASEKKSRAHERARAATWRETKEDKEDMKDMKKFQTPAQKKKVAFIKGELHTEAASANAYLVFGYSPHRKPGSGLAPHVLDPTEAARLAVERCDGTIFHERTIRVDRVGKRNASGDSSSDPKRTLFVGNLDFASKEEDVRVFFEGVVATERGPPPEAEAEGQGAREASKRGAWVNRVRLVSFIIAAS